MVEVKTQPDVSNSYPKGVFPILFLEFCERFSFYGTKAILTLYMTRALGLTDNTATSIYHGFSAACYVTPILGGLIADGGLGKYRTIVYFSLLYIVGYICQTLSAIKFGDSYTIWITYIALIVLSFGSGIIKPCKSALGGDQFNDDQEHLKEGFFSWFYMAINVGSLIATFLTPIIRSNVSCFNDVECYALAFGIPAALMTVGYIVFVVATPLYRKLPTQESVLPRMCGCVGTALKERGCCGSNKDPSKEHWLDYADAKYEKSFIDDVKDVMKVLWLFLPLPIFWALFDQQGSRWILQAGQMDGDFGSFAIEPDQLQVANALFVVILIPILEGLIFPCTVKLNVMAKPLQRMGVGMFLAAVAFLVAGGLQVVVDDSEPAGIADGMARFKFINTAPCKAQFMTPFLRNKVELDSGMDSEYSEVQASSNLMFNLTLEGCGEDTIQLSSEFEFREKFAYIILASDDGHGLFMESYESEKTSRTGNGQSTVWLINSLGEVVDVDLKSGKENDPREFRNITNQGYSQYEELIFDDYDAYLLQENEADDKLHIGQVESKNGAVYTLVLYNNGTQPVLSQFQDVEQNSVNIFWQIPQYFIMTLGECLFSVTGLGFAYTQAPASMKSVLTAAWLLTIGVGNIVVIIVSEAGSALGQMEEFFLFAGLMLFTVILFVIMAYSYEYVESNEEEPDKGTDDVALSNGTSKVPIEGNYNVAFSKDSLDPGADIQSESTQL